MEMNTILDGSKNILDFQDPGPIKEELLDVPGFVNQLTEYTLTQANCPNRPLAFLGALAMLAHLAGRGYADGHGTYTNLYVIALGDTGIGKDAPRCTNHKLADAIGQSYALSDNMASGEALEERMIKNPIFLFQPDEVELFFNAMRGSGKNAVSLSGHIRQFFSASKSKYITRSTVKDPNGVEIPHPHLTIFGTGTPTAFFDSLNERAIVNGLFGRCLVLPIADSYQTNIVTEKPIPQEIVDIARWHVDNNRRTTRSQFAERVLVAETPQAISTKKSCADTLMIIRKRMADSELFMARALVARMDEKIAKLAMLRAISINPKNPLVDEECVEWAMRFVAYITKCMLYEAQFRVAEGKFDRLVKRFVGLIAKHGGSLDRRSIIRSLHIDDLTFIRIVRTLQMCDEIIEEVEYGRNATYTLKQPA